MIKECYALKLYRHARVNSRGLANNALAAAGTGFKLSSEHEKDDYNVASMKKYLVRITFYTNVTDASIPCAVMHFGWGYWYWDLIIYLLRIYCVN